MILIKIQSNFEQGGGEGKDLLQLKSKLSIIKYYKQMHMLTVDYPFITELYTIINLKYLSVNNSYIHEMFVLIFYRLLVVQIKIKLSLQL